MAYESYVFDDFSGGLNLKDKADAVGPNECINCRDVVFTDRGAVAQRAGFEAFTGSALTNLAESLHPHYESDGTEHLLAGCGTRLEAINSSGSVVASLTGLTSSGGPWYWDFCRVGTASAEYSYAGNGENVLKRWDGSSWSSIANTPQAGALCVTPSSNRVVAARFKGTTGGPAGGAGSSNPSRVYFSDPGAPETWTTTNYLDLDPGDGEMIQAAITWREYVFVFKETKFYVFTGESTDADGNPVFNYRKIDTGVGMCGPRAVAVNENGVYFGNSEGMYVTTGEAPVKLSAKVDPIFYESESPAYFTLDAMDHAYASRMALGAWRDMVLLSYPSSSTLSHTLVHDTQDEWWSLWLPFNGLGCFSTYRVSGVETLVAGGGANGNNKKVLLMDGTATNDYGTEITSYWRSAFTDLDSPNIKRVRQMKLWGSGVIGLKPSLDFKISPGNATTLDFSGTGYLLNPTLYRVSMRGTVFSVQFGNSTLDQEWAVHRMAYHITTPRQVTVPKVDR